MKEPIQRYSQGFGGFGPLEKCNDGKLVKFEDHQRYITIANDKYSRAYEDSVDWMNLSSKHKLEFIKKDTENLELKCKLIDLKFACFFTSFVSLCLLAIILTGN